MSKGFRWGKGLGRVLSNDLRWDPKARPRILSIQSSHACMYICMYIYIYMVRSLLVARQVEHHICTLTNIPQEELQLSIKQGVTHLRGD